MSLMTQFKIVYLLGYLIKDKKQYWLISCDKYIFIFLSFAYKCYVTQQNKNPILKRAKAKGLDENSKKDDCLQTSFKR